MRTRVLLLFAPLILACSAVDGLKPRAPDVDADVSVTKISPAGIELLVEVAAMNPNDIDLEARFETARVVLDDQYEMGTMVSPQQIDLPSDQEVHVFVPVTVNWKDASVVASLIEQKRDVRYQVDGEVKVGIDLFKVKVHFHVSNVITQAQLRQAASG